MCPHLPTQRPPRPSSRHPALSLLYLSLTLALCQEIQAPVSTPPEPCARGQFQGSPSATAPCLHPHNPRQPFQTNLSQKRGLPEGYCSRGHPLGHEGQNTQPTLGWAGPGRPGWCQAGLGSALVSGFWLTVLGSTGWRGGRCFFQVAQTRVLMSVVMGTVRPAQGQVPWPQESGFLMGTGPTSTTTPV